MVYVTCGPWIRQQSLAMHFQSVRGCCWQTIFVHQARTNQNKHRNATLQQKRNILSVKEYQSWGNKKKIRNFLCFSGHLQSRLCEMLPSADCCKNLRSIPARGKPPTRKICHRKSIACQLSDLFLYKLTNSTVVFCSCPCLSFFPHFNLSACSCELYLFEGRSDE